MTSTLSYRWKRLRSMSSEEIAERVRQYLVGRSDYLRYRFRKTVSAPALVQGRARANFFFSPAQVEGLCAMLRERMPGQVSEVVQRAEKICGHHFDLLGYENLDYGTTINWHLDAVHGKIAPRKPFFHVRYLDFAEVGDSKVTWELNRHQHLVTLAKAYRLTGDHKFAKEIFSQWKHWHAENPYPIGVNWASSLEVAFRSISWIWTYFLLADTPAVPAGFRSEWLSALHTSGRHIHNHLSTYFSANTHLLGEGLALFFIGTVCPELPQAQQWKQRGWTILTTEAQRQVQHDGVYFEQSLYYHVYALDFLVHAAVLANLNDVPVPLEFERTMERMLDVLCLLGRAGTPASLGDDDGGRLFDPQRNRAEHLLDPLATGAVLFGRGDFKFVSGGLREETIWLVGEPGVAEFDRLPELPPINESTALHASGLYVMSGDHGQQLVVDAGPQGAVTAGHGHADALSVWVNCGGRSLLVDSGTFEYVGGGTERDVFRGTSAHNTLSVDGSSQSDPRGPFGWSRLPKATAEGWICGENFDLFVGSHDGYTRIANPVVHRRWVFSLKSGFWLVRDVAEGTGKHQLDLNWHLSPELSARGRRTDTFLDRAGRAGVAIITPKNHGWSHDIHKEWRSPRYGCRERVNVLHFGTLAALPTEFVTLLLPVADGVISEGDLVPVRGAPDQVSAYRYTTPEEDSCVYFSRQRGAWSVDRWTTDAEFLYFRRSGETSLLICCNATHLEIHGTRIMSSPRPVLRCEFVMKGEEATVASSLTDLTVDKTKLPTLLAATEPALAPAPSASERVKL